jgi:hypothetical protein
VNALKPSVLSVALSDFVTEFESSEGGSGMVPAAEVRMLASFLLDTGYLCRYTKGGSSRPARNGRVMSRMQASDLRPSWRLIAPPKKQQKVPRGESTPQRDVKNEDCSGDVYENKGINDKMSLQKVGHLRQSAAIQGKIPDLLYQVTRRFRFMRGLFVETPYSFLDCEDRRVKDEG